MSTPHHHRLKSACIFILFLFGSCKKDFDSLFTDNESDKFTSQSTRISNQPNIILIIGDDIGYEIPTYTGGGSYSTPNLDFMAANGMQFTNFFSHPDGPPSRLALMTGKYNFRNWDRFGFLPPDSKSVGNMLHDAGYATCYVGKWQFDGGDTSLRQHGFDNYLVFLPFTPGPNTNPGQNISRYKSPYLYQNAHFLPDSLANGKYADDLFFDYSSDFIDRNLTKPFFLVYSSNLAQQPWSPTPDNPDFSAWDPTIDDANGDKKYFPDMIAYMDKIIGKIINKTDAVGLSQNTIIIFAGDNATNRAITSQFKGKPVSGGKVYTSMPGLKVPMVVYWPGHVAPACTDTSLTDMTDILPTFADIAKTIVPSTWGKIDGVTFYDNLISSISKGKQRSYVYCYWPAYGEHTWGDISFVYDYNYKLYDSLSATHVGGDFFNIKNDPDEKAPLKNSQLSPSERLIKRKFKTILDSVQLQKLH